jgi:hypothetical protein
MFLKAFQLFQKDKFILSAQKLKLEIKVPKAFLFYIFSIQHKIIYQYLFKAKFYEIFE